MANEQLEAQRQAGLVASRLQAEIGRLIRPGLNILAIKELVDKRIEQASMRSAFLGFEGYPASCCISVDEEVVHAIPKSRILEEGSLVSVDIGIENRGWIVDMARTYAVGSISSDNKRLLKGTAQALDYAIKTAKHDPRPSAIGKTIEEVISRAGLFVIRDLSGHGVGRSLQEPPSILNYANTHKKILPAGKTIAIEPIIATKSCQLVIMPDNWTISTVDQTITAQFEDTIMITEDSVINLTRHPEERQMWPSPETWEL